MDLDSFATVLRPKMQLQTFANSIKPIYHPICDSVYEQYTNCKYFCNQICDDIVVAKYAT